jgi:hypothetical protein
MKVSEVKKIILNSLIPISDEYNYKINKGNFELVKKGKEYTSALSFTDVHWFDEVQLKPSIWVDVEVINEIWKKFDTHISYTYIMNLRELKDWYDLGEVSWEKFQLNDFDRYKLFNYDNDIINASNDIQNLFKTYGLKYINDFSNVEGVDKLYNSNLLEDNHENPHCAGFQVKSIVGLISAKLSSNPNYKEITEVYSDMLQKHKLEDTMNLVDIERFYKIKEYLG